MLSRTGLRRFLALAMVLLFLLGLFASPALAKSRTFSGSGGFSSGSRSFTTPKSSPLPSSPSRSFSSTPTPKVTTPAPSTTAPGSFSTSPPAGTSSPTQTYSSTVPGSFSSGSRSFSSSGGSFSSQKPGAGSTTSLPDPATVVPPVTYDPTTTSYPGMPPVVVIGPTVYDPAYYHDYYYGMPWYWRIWYRPQYSASGGWSLSWIAIGAALFAVWVLLGVLSSMNAKRRRNR